MSTHFKIDYKGWSDDASPINPNIKIKASHAKLVANQEISERNKDIKFREKVSKGVKKYYGSSEERFFDNLIKQKNGCWIYPKLWIMENKIQYQAKVYSAKIHKLKFNKECIIQSCGNSKCVNPKHLINISREQTALTTVSKRKLVIRKNNPNAKLSDKDVKNIHKMYERFLKQRNGKHKGIATEIHKVYNKVSLSMICQIIKNK